MIYTFWEGEMPEYIKMCLDTWHISHTILKYRDLEDIGIDKDKLKPFTLPQIADIVRVHILRDRGGVWLDADTILLSKELPTETILGYPEKRINTIGYLRTEPHSDMFEKWAEYQDKVMDNPQKVTWDIVGNKFTDPYLKEHDEITIGDITNRWAETYMIKLDADRYWKYKQFYFKENYKLSDLRSTDILMLHNSWTPEWFKYASRDKILNTECTLSNIFKEVL